MQAMRLHRAAPASQRPLRLERVPEPRPGPAELLVRVRACGVCRTDLHVIEGDLPAVRLPLVPGHMVVGEVADRGAEVEGWEHGARLGIAWLRGTCGTCTYCAAARENLCPRASFTGYHADGGYAEYATVPAAWAYPLPPTANALSDLELAPLLCAGIIGYRALKLSGAAPGERLGLFGFGNSAHIVLQLARARGCEVHVASRGGRHRELALEMGAARVAEAAAFEPESLHAAILFAPAGELVPPILRALRRGGTLACAGIHMSPIPGIDYDRELFGERVLRSVTANTRQDGLELLAEAAALSLRPRVEAFALEDAGEALLRLATDRIRGSAVLALA